MIKRITSVLAIFILLLSPVPVSAEEVSATSLREEDIESEFAISMVAETGEVLFEKNAHERAFPASMTKIMTGIILLENVAEDELITMTHQSLFEARSNFIAEFSEGEQMDRDTALDFLMILSANDVAMSIAEHIAGSNEDFGKLMTEKARELGAMNTNFTNASGLHDDGHYTTAYDMALIAQAALQYPRLVEAMSTDERVLTTSMQEINVTNFSPLYSLDNFFGGKTGFTGQAQPTLTKISEQNGVHLINVVMYSSIPARYEDVEKMSEYGFSHMEHRVVLDKNKFSKTVEVLGQEIDTGISSSVQVTTTRNSQSEVTTAFRLRDFTEEELYAKGIFIGEEVGKLDVIVDGEIVDTVAVLSEETVLFVQPFQEIALGAIQELVQSTSFIIGVSIFGGVIVLIFIIRTVNIRRRRKRVRRNRQYTRTWED